MTDIDHIELTAELVAAYVAHNAVAVADLPSLLHSVYAAVSGLGKEPETVPEARREPAVPIKKSVTPDYIISLEDGRKLKSMKRYLGKLGMTPAEYRAKWGLPHDYPIVAPNYAARRSELAKTLGLGRRAA
jgi:predicted transcriptional regulator